MKKLVIRNDVRKLAVISISFALIGVALVALAMSERSNTFLLVCAVAICAVLLAAIVANVRRMLDRSPLLELTEEGFTDYTKPDDVLSLPWSQVLQVQLQAANSNDLVLDIMGYKTKEQLGEVSDAMQEQLDQNQTDRVYLVAELSGLWIRRSRVREAFQWIKDNAKNKNPELTFTEFQDPLSKLGRGKDDGGSGGRRVWRFGKKGRAARAAREAKVAEQAAAKAAEQRAAAK